MLQLARDLPPTHRTALLWALSSYKLHLPSHKPGADAHRRVSVACCKPCAKPHDSEDKAIFTGGAGAKHSQQLHHTLEKSPPYGVTQVSAPLQRLEVEKITGHHSVRGLGGATATMAITQWAGFSRPSRGREAGLHLSRQRILFLLGRHTRPTLPDRAPVPPDGSWRCTRNFLEATANIFLTWLRRRPARGLSSSLQHYGASQRGSFMMQT